MTILAYIVITLCSLILIASVLLQPSKGGGLTTLGGSSQSVFGSTGGTTFLFRTTMLMAAIIGITSLWLTRSQIQKSRSSVIDVTAPAIDPNALKAPESAPAASAPADTSPQAVPTPSPAPSTPAGQ